MSKVQVDTIDTRSGTSTMQIGSTNTSTINIGVSGDTVNIPSGVTIANAGTATGFGESNTPAFMGFSSANQSIAYDTDTKLTIGTESYDTDSAFSSSRFTVPSGKAGKYMFGGQCRISSIADEKTMQLMVYKNGSSLDRAKTKFRNAGTSSMATNVVFCDDASVGDYYELYVYHDRNSTETANSGHTTFWGFRITS